MTGHAPSTATSANMKSAGFMIAAMSLFAASDVLMKYIGGQLPVGEMMFLRGLFATSFLIIAIKLASSDRIRFRDLLNLWSVFRGLCEVLITFLFLNALNLLPIALATTLLFAAPIFMTALSIPILGERVGIWRWGAVVLGFIGVIVVTAPGINDMGMAIFLPLAAACVVALRDVLVRFVPGHIPSGSVALTTSIAVTAGGAVSIPLAWVGPDATQLGLMALAAAIVCSAYLVYILATRSGELSFTAPFKYVIVLWAILFGMLIWDEVPTAHEWLGALTIVISGLIILYRENLGRPANTTV